MATTTLLFHPLSDMLPDGTEIRRVPDMKRTGNRPLYTTFDGAPYSHILLRDHVHGGYKSIYRLQVPTVDTCPCNRFNGNRVQRYFKMVHFGGIYLAHAVALAWIGEQQTDEEGRPFQCHHLNGVTFDNRGSNLIWLSRADHRLYDARQKALRELLGNLQIFERSDFDRWHAMPEPDFQAMLANYYRDPSHDPMEYDMTHHREF